MSLENNRRDGEDSILFQTSVGTEEFDSMILNFWSTKLVAFLAMWVWVNNLKGFQLSLSEQSKIRLDTNISIFGVANPFVALN